MNNKEVVKEIRNILQAYYFVDVLSADCSIDSLIRIDRKAYDCDNCILADTINTIRIMCPLTMKRETRVLK